MLKRGSARAGCGLLLIRGKVETPTGVWLTDDCGYGRAKGDTIPTASCPRRPPTLVSTPPSSTYVVRYTRRLRHSLTLNPSTQHALLTEKVTHHQCPKTLATSKSASRQRAGRLRPSRNASVPKGSRLQTPAVRAPLYPMCADLTAP